MDATPRTIQESIIKNELATALANSALEYVHMTKTGRTMNNLDCPKNDIGESDEVGQNDMSMERDSSGPLRKRKLIAGRNVFQAINKSSKLQSDVNTITYSKDMALPNTVVPDEDDDCAGIKIGHAKSGRKKDVEKHTLKKSETTRETRLEQNRVAARKSRMRKKVMIHNFQHSIAYYTRANDVLMKENLALTRMLECARIFVQNQTKGVTNVTEEGKRSIPQSGQQQLTKFVETGGKNDVVSSAAPRSECEAINDDSKEICATKVKEADRVDAKINNKLNHPKSFTSSGLENNDGIGKSEAGILIRNDRTENVADGSSLNIVSSPALNAAACAANLQAAAANFQAALLASMVGNPFIGHGGIQTQPIPQSSIVPVFPFAQYPFVSNANGTTQEMHFVPIETPHEERKEGSDVTNPKPKSNTDSDIDMKESVIKVDSIKKEVIEERLENPTPKDN